MICIENILKILNSFVRFSYSAYLGSLPFPQSCNRPHDIQTGWFAEAAQAVMVLQGAIQDEGLLA